MHCLEVLWKLVNNQGPPQLRKLLSPNSETTREGEFIEVRKKRTLHTGLRPNRTVEEVISPQAVRFVARSASEPSATLFQVLALTARKSKFEATAINASFKQLDATFYDRETGARSQLSFLLQLIALTQLSRLISGLS